MNKTKLIESSKRIEAYRPNPTVESIAAGLGVPVKEVFKLDANENLFLDRSIMMGILVEAAYETDPRLYPQDEEESLKHLIAKLNQVKSTQIVVSAGGDQIIELIFSLLRWGDSVTAVTPTFSMYSRLARQRGIKYREASLKPDFSLNVEKTLRIANDSSVLVVCNPNNPTGNQFSREEILRLVKGFSGLVLVDEAYQEYSSYSLVDETANYENLIILRTFSKAYGLAGLRLGYCISNESLTYTLRERYQLPYPVPNIVLKTGCRILEKQALIRESIDKTNVTRAWLIDELNKLDGVEAFPSETNFVLFNTDKSYTEVHTVLLSKGILVRKIGKVLSKENCLRVTVAPKPMLKQFLVSLEEVTK